LVPALERVRAQELAGTNHSLTWPRRTQLAASAFFLPHHAPALPTFQPIERTYLAANTAGMAKKLEPPKLVTWDVYRAANKPKIVGSVQAVDADEAVKKAAEEFKVDAWRLIAVQRR
jgi:hypothetical protein